MQVRPLSATSYWIEMPLSAQTCLLVWAAMAACGLRQGKINSYEDEHFGPRYSWRDHLVEGRTAEGFLDERTKLQAKLSASEGGTLLEFEAANTKNQPDFGSSWRVRRRLVPRIVQFIEEAPSNWMWQQKVSNIPEPPIASPTAFQQKSAFASPSFEMVVPIFKFRLSAKDWVRMTAIAPIFVLAIYLRAGWLLLLGLAGWEIWRAKQLKTRLNWIGILFLLGMGFWDLYIVLRA